MRLARSPGATRTSGGPAGRPSRAEATSPFGRASGTVRIQPRPGHSLLRASAAAENAEPSTSPFAPALPRI